MKPRTKIQRLIFEISNSLPNITEKQKQYAYEHCFPFYGYRTKLSHVTCMECGGEFESFESKDRCPRCGRRLSILDTRKKKQSNTQYFALLHRVGDFQVVRHFEITEYLIKGQSRSHTMREVCQMFYDVENRKAHYVALKVNYNSRWVASSELEVRDLAYRGGYLPNEARYNITPTAVYPTKSIHPTLKRNGFRGSFFGFSARGLFDRLLLSKGETLFKVKQWELFSVVEHRTKDIYDFWHSIKVAIRNNYFVLDATLWFDYLRLLRQFRKDTHNAHYVCPKNLREAHDYWDRRRREEEAKYRRAEEVEKMKNKKASLEKKSMYFGLCFISGKIKIIVLDSVEAYVEEGDVMHHCVSTYISRTKSLVMSARNIETGERIETVEVSLKTFEVVQSRGVCNTNTDQHDEIISIVNSNMGKIRKIAQQYSA